MSKQITLIQATIAAVLLAVGVAHAAAPQQEIVKLPRVVITGKAAAPQVAQIEQLPRVVVTGLSANSRMQQQMLAAAAARPSARAL